MNESLEEREYFQRLALLPREIAPADDVWPRIAARIDASAGGSSVGRRRPRAWRWAAAASILIVIAAGLLFDRHRPVSVEETSPEMASATAGQEAPGFLLPGSSAAGELEYQGAFREFMALNDAAGMAEVSRPDWVEQGWGTLRKTELALSKALKSEPDNEFLKSRLAALRARQIELLRQIAALDTLERNTI